MTEQQHSKTPWKSYPEDLRGGRAFTVARPGQDGDAICIWDEDNGEADAAFIVKAVNSYDVLIEALAGYERFITMMHEMVGENGYKSGIALAQERCRKELDRIDSVMSQVKDAVGTPPQPKE